MTTKQKRQISELEIIQIAEQVKWSTPLSLTQLAIIFDHHPNTIRQWLKKGIIRNKHFSPRRWCVLYEDLPAELFLPILSKLLLEKIEKKQQPDSQEIQQFGKLAQET